MVMALAWVHGFFHGALFGAAIAALILRARQQS